jgi:hypothetical protein
VEADSIEAKAIAETPDEVEIEEVAPVKVKPKAKVSTDKPSKRPAKTTKTKEKTPCQYCNKLFVNTDKHENRCKKNPGTEAKTSPKAESIAIKA